MTDLLLFAALVASFFLFTGWTPFARFSVVAGSTLAGFAYFGLFRLWPGVTPAQWAWQLAPSQKTSAHLLDLAGGAPLKERPSGILLSVFSLVAACVTFKLAVLDHPLWRAVDEVELEATIPKGSGWNFSPYYYALGAWPTRFEGKPIFLDLPYQPGPPQVFPGKILARWVTPQITLIIEGPKTPPYLSRLRRPRERLKECLLGERHSISCAKIRAAALERHLSEMSRIGHQRSRPRRWEISWITVRQGALPPEEYAQGFRLSACTSTACQDRFVLVTPNGTHQAFILDLDSEQPARVKLARDLLEQSIRSLRVSDQLGFGRAWADRQIEATRLREVFATRDPAERAQKLADAESALLSKISVDPGTYESYYFLAHLGLTLGRIAARDPSISTASDWSAIARPLVMASVKYAKDVAPKDPRNSELESIQVEAQKY